MRNKLIVTSVALSMLSIQPAFSNEDLYTIKKEVELLKQSYEQRIRLLEEKLDKTQVAAEKANSIAQQAVEQKTISSKNTNKTENNFNPAISLILDGRYVDFDNVPDQYHIPGFSLGGEAGLGEKGFSLGHTELTASANIDNQFYGEMTLAIHEHEGETEVEIEEAFAQTIGLGNGLTFKVGRFFSAMGYVNEQHEHAWDFADAPLIYRGLFGGQLRDDGLQLSYIAPTDIFLQFGTELTRGDNFPAANSDKSIGAWNVFTNLGGDIGIEHSWSLGLSHWNASDISERTGAGHSHGGAATETPAFYGESKISAVDFVYKWAPNGNPKNKNVKFQFEYFMRKENGRIDMLGSSPFESSSYQGENSGFYAQTIYQFMPQWRTGIRYDYLDSNNTGDDEDVLDEAGLHDEGHNPERYSAMLEWVPSEFSRLRLQFNHDKSYEQDDNQVFLQYTFSLGSHGAHLF